MTEKTRFHVFISGKVQGVFFRYSTIEKAKELGLLGWVKNLNDGRVEAIIQGDREVVQKMIEWLKRGPRFARVKNLIFEEEKYVEEFTNFERK
jgi:acylphosphatase